MSPAEASPSLAAPAQTFPASVIRVVDGDTIPVTVSAWDGSPLGTVKVRISGIAAEVKLGKAASAFAKTLLHPSDAVTLSYRGLDKYARVDGDLTLPHGRDFGTVMLASGMARPYGGRTKSNWCKRVPLPPAKPAR